MSQYAHLINRFVGIAVVAIFMTLIALAMSQYALMAITATVMIVAAACVNRLAGKRR